MRLLILFFAILVSFNGIAQEKNLEPGDAAPQFKGTDDEGNQWKSSDVESDFIVLYFYPAAMTGGCTKQACAYRDQITEFNTLSATVIGISGDEPKNLAHFKSQYQLNFPLISDLDGSIAASFGVPTGKGGQISREIDGQTIDLFRNFTHKRWTFILNKERKIIYKNAAVNASEDSNSVVAAIRAYRSE